MQTKHIIKLVHSWKWMKNFKKSVLHSTKINYYTWTELLRKLCDYLSTLLEPLCLDDEFVEICMNKSCIVKSISCQWKIEIQPVGSIIDTTFGMLIYFVKLYCYHVHFKFTCWLMCFITSKHHYIDYFHYICIEYFFQNHIFIVPAVIMMTVIPSFRPSTTFSSQFSWQIHMTSTYI